MVLPAEQLEDVDHLRQDELAVCLARAELCRQRAHLSHQRGVALGRRLAGPGRVGQVEVGLEVHHRGLDLEGRHEFAGVGRFGFHTRDQIVDPFRAPRLAAYAPVERLEALGDVGAGEVALGEKVRRLVVGVAVHGLEVSALGGDRFRESLDAHSKVLSPGWGTRAVVPSGCQSRDPG